MLVGLALIFVSLTEAWVSIHLNSTGQVDVYRPFTVVESWLQGRDLYGSFVGPTERSPSFHVARNVCAPYTVLKYNNSLSVISSPCGRCGTSKLYTQGRWFSLDIGRYIIVRYDFVTEYVFTYIQDVLLVHKLFGPVNMKAIRIANLTDFYVADKTFFLLRNQTLFRNTECLGPYKSSKLTMYYIPTSSSTLYSPAWIIILALQLINLYS